MHSLMYRQFVRGLSGGLTILALAGVFWFNLAAWAADCIRAGIAMGSGEEVPFHYLQWEPPAALADPMQVVVYSEQGRSIGLIVGQINDIVETALTVKRDAPRRGIAGSAVIQDKVTDLVDVPGIIRAAEPNFYSGAANP